jgi:hypothetical protein
MLRFAPAITALHSGLRAGLADSRPRFAAGLEALILALLLRLFGRTEVARHVSPHFDRHDDRPYDAYAIASPPMGRAPHAAVVEAGLVPDWVLSGIRNRGMRPAAVPARPRRRARPARAPP